MEKCLSEIQKEYKIKISAFVLMSNHFHLLALSPEHDIDKVMYVFMRRLTHLIQKKSGRVNRIFGGRYKGCLIENERYLLNAFKYIYRNPVAAFISEKVEDYPFSTLQYFHHNQKLKFELEHPFEQTQKLIDWLNCSFEKDEIESIRFGLSRTKFEYKKDHSTNRLITPKTIYIQ